MTTFDFGFGPVKAHRHTNPNGSEGGWVADTANVEKNAWVSGDARVSGNEDFVVIGPIGSRSAFLTVTFKPKLLVTTGCFEGETLAAFKKAVRKKHDKTKYATEYNAAIKFIEVLAKVRK